MFGGEKGIRTLEYIPALHDFQSCAFDQLSHLSTVYNLLIILFVDTFRLESFQSCGDQLSHLSTVYNLLIILFVDTFRLESFQSCGDQLSHLSTVYV